MEVNMKRPTKKAFYEYMSMRSDRLIYRNMMAVAGVELTPQQVDEYLATVEYGLEYIA